MGGGGEGDARGPLPSQMLRSPAGMSLPLPPPLLGGQRPSTPAAEDAYPWRAYKHWKTEVPEAEAFLYRWIAMVAFLENTGHLARRKAPAGHSLEPGEEELGVWLAQQRMKFNGTEKPQLSAQQQEALRRIPDATGKREDAWRLKLSALQEFAERESGCPARAATRSLASASRPCSANTSGAGGGAPGSPPWIPTRSKPWRPCPSRPGARPKAAAASLPPARKAPGRSGVRRARGLLQPLVGRQPTAGASGRGRVQEPGGRSLKTKRPTQRAASRGTRQHPTALLRRAAVPVGGSGRQLASWQRSFLLY